MMLTIFHSVTRLFRTVFLSKSSSGWEGENHETSFRRSLFLIESLENQKNFSIPLLTDASSSFLFWTSLPFSIIILWCITILYFPIVKKGVIWWWPLLLIFFFFPNLTPNIHFVFYWLLPSKLCLTDRHDGIANTWINLWVTHRMGRDDDIHTRITRWLESKGRDRSSLEDSNDLCFNRWRTSFSSLS